MGLFPQLRLLPLLMLLWLLLPVLPLLVTPAAAPAVAAIVAFVVVGCWTYREDLPICQAPMVGARPQFEDSRQSMRLIVEDSAPIAGVAARAVAGVAAEAVVAAGATIWPCRC